jgi:hypothetical protein
MEIDPNIREIRIARAPPESKKKLVVSVVSKNSTRNIQIGDRKYEDYTIHRDDERKAKYIQRHSRNRERYGLDGIKTAGFYSRWLLWSKPTLIEAAKDLAEMTGLPVFLEGKKVE